MTSVSAAGARREEVRPRFRLRSRAPYLGAAAALVGLLLVILGFLSATFVPTDIYRDPLGGYDPPFDVIAGLLLVALSIRIRDRSPVAWIFSLIAPTLAVFVAVVSPNAFSITAAVASSLVVAAIFPYRSGFFRGSGAGPEATSLLVVVTALLSLLFGMVGARWLGSQFAPAPGIQGWGDALYFTITTISTNGSNYTPLTDTARWYVVILILLGVGTFLSAVVVLFLPFLQRRLEGITERLERAQMDELRDHVVICGVSAEARATAEALREEGVRTVILATDAHGLDLLKAEGLRTHHGDPSTEEDLKAVGVDRARALIVAQTSDAESLLTVITARALLPGLRIVAVAAADSSLPKLRRAGASEAISVVNVAAKLVSEAALSSGSSPTRK